MIINVSDMLSSSYAKEKAENRKALYAFISKIRFLTRQGLPLRGSHVGVGCGESNSNFIQLLQLRKADIPVLDKWLSKSQNRFTSPSIQNELIEIMASKILWKFSSKLAGELISNMVDETTDISNTEQLVFCIWYVDSKLNSHEEFIGLHSLESTTAEHISRTILDIMLRLSLQLNNCRGQCYDGANTMAGCKTFFPPFPDLFLKGNFLTRCLQYFCRWAQ